MQLKYGSYPFDSNTTLLSTQIFPQVNRGGQIYSQRKRFTIQGYLAGDGQAELTLKENALKTALARPYQDLLFLKDDGSASSEVLLNATSITGVLVTDGPHFQTTQGPEYATLRTFTFTAEAEYPVPEGSNYLLDFNETLSFEGGGPLYIHRRAINGPPQKQLVYPATEYKVTQTGRAIGYRAYPTPPAPKFPFALKESPKIDRGAPERKGNGYQGYEVTWTYVFESAGPLVALPTLWI